MNERIFMLETLRYWLLKSFYVKVVDYNNLSGFNRHIFAHAKSEVWQKPTNFYRALGLIQGLAFVDCFANKDSKISIFPPSPDIRTENMRQEIITCKTIQVIKDITLVKKKIKTHIYHQPNLSNEHRERVKHMLEGYESENDPKLSQLLQNLLKF